MLALVNMQPVSSRRAVEFALVIPNCGVMSTLLNSYLRLLFRLNVIGTQGAFLIADVRRDVKKDA